MMETVSPQDDSSGANPSSVKSDDSSPQQERGGGSPPPNCAICLGTCRNKSFTDSCLHQFCFKCLLTWSKVKAECPLCKQNFKSIIHNVRSNHQYEEYMVEQRHTEETTERIDIDSLIENAPRFRYRTTLTLTRRETMAIQQLLPHYPMMADVFLPPAPRAPQTRRRSSTSFRRTIYRHNLWARPLPDFTGRFRDCSPEFYRYNDPQMHRLVPWLNRELSYLLNENVGHISYVIARILELLPQYAINSPEFREAMQRYFGNRTEHFLHELYCFASTPYDMAGYDRNVQYTTDSRISTMVNEIISSSESDASVDSDIVMVSSSEPAEPPPGPSRRPPAPVYPQNYISQPSTAENVIPIETISHSDTDDDSSEVMVVGYIKPPQHRTPEIVDLLGSDSDVIVQDNAQPEMSQSVSANPSAEPQESRHVPLVKLSLKQHPKREPERSDSEDSTYRPPAPPPARPRRRRRRSAASAASTASAASAASASTSATRRSTPSPRRAEPARSTPSSRSLYSPPSSPASPASPSAPSAPSAPSTPSTYTTCRSSTTVFDDEPTSPSPSPYASASASSDDFDDRRKRHERRKSKKKTSRHARDRKRSTKSTRSHRKIEKNTLSELEKNRRGNRKSYSGKGVKSSKKKGSGDSVDLAVNQQQALLDQPSTSGTSRNSRRSGRKRERSRSSHSTRENKRLRSVVNVMNNQKNSSDAISNGNPNLLNILSDAILNPNSNVLAYNSDSGSVPYDDRTRRVNDVPPEILEKAESCFNIELLTAKHVSDHSDSDDNLPLNLTVQKRT